MKRPILLLLFGLLTGLSCRKASTEYVSLNNGQISLLSIMKVNFNFSLFLYAVNKTGLDTLFSSTAAHTVLLPDNTAFANAGITTTAQLDAIAPDSLRRLVRFHVLPLLLLSPDIPTTINAPYLNIDADSLYFSNDGAGIRVNGDTVISVDTKAINGVIHVLNRPLSLPSASVKSFLLSDTAYSYLTTGLQRFGLLDRLDTPGGPFTLVAPLNSAFLGRGIGADSIARMDTLHFKKLLFSASIITGSRMFNADLNDRFFLPPIVYPGDFNLPVAYLDFVYPDHILLLTDHGSWEVFDPNRSSLNPAFTGVPAFLGPSAYPGAQATDPDHISVNGVVHGLGDILIFPDSVSIPQ